MRIGLTKFLILAGLIWVTLTAELLGQGNINTRRKAKKQENQTAEPFVSPPTVEPKTKVKVSTPKPIDTGVKGKVIDANSNEPLSDAVVYLQSTTDPSVKIGIISSLDGDFMLKNVQPGDYTLNISYIGYADYSQPVSFKEGGLDLQEIRLVSNDIGLEEVKIIASIGIERQTPVSISNIDYQTLESRNGALKFPDAMRITPSVYTSRAGGGFGDGRINVRGFDQQNTAVMINGIPINDMSNGWVYWSNWQGLADVTRTVQVQRGLGASRIAISSIGGTINIITKTAEMSPGGSVIFEKSNVFDNRAAFTLHTGKNSNGWAASMAASYAWGEGYIPATDHKTAFYYFSVSKEINMRHTVSLTGLGAPQEHGQRVTQFTQADYARPGRGFKFNGDWGRLDGQVLNQRINFYHKGQFALSHFWHLSDKTRLTTVLYFSPGRGGGSGPTTVGGYRLPTTPEGQIDWERVRRDNSNRRDTITVAGGSKVIGSSARAIIRNSINHHNWYGGISTLNTKLSENIKLLTGLDFRFFKSENYREVRNLLGADFYYEGKNFNINKPDNFARVGAKIQYDRQFIINWYGGFAELEYNKGNLAASITGSYSITSHQRVDFFTYRNNDPAQKSRIVDIPAFTLKGGVNYNLNSTMNIYGNAGIFTRSPFIELIYVNNRNEVAKDYTNEKVTSFELGYGYRGKYLTFDINGYYTIWKDKSILGNRITYPDGSSTRPFIKGIEALHTGIEVEIAAKPLKNLTLTSSISVGNWRWTNNVTALIVNDFTNKIDTFRVFAENLKVGDAPQTTLGLNATYRIKERLTFGADFFYYADLYANFDVATRNIEKNKGKQALKLPDFALVDINAAYNLPLYNKISLQLKLNIHNLLDKIFIAEALDGSDSTFRTARLFYGFGRTYSAQATISF